MVVPERGTWIRCFLASSTPLRMASVYSPALPKPKPTKPLRSPTTTRARMLNRRPPLTTLETRLTSTTVSSRFSFEASILAISLLAALETQANFTSAFSECGDRSMIGIATTVKDNATHTLFLRTLGNQFAYFARDCHLAIAGDCLQSLFGCPGNAFLRGRQQGLDLGRGFATLLGLSTLLRLSTFRRGFFSLRAPALRSRGSLSGYLYRSGFHWLSM